MIENATFIVDTFITRSYDAIKSLHILLPTFCHSKVEFFQERTERFSIHLAYASRNQNIRSHSSRDVTLRRG